MKTFNVLLFENGKIEHYDVLPYFRKCWEDKFDLEEKNEIKEKNRPENKRKHLLKAWIIHKSQYMFWARCQYEFLIASWPFGSKRMFDELHEFLPKFNIDDYMHHIDFDNIIIRDMYKIDIHEQIMMNIDVITDILHDEFNKVIKKK